MTPQDLEQIRVELGVASQEAMADVLQCDYTGYKRWATGARPIPRYIERSVRAMLFIKQNKLQKEFGKYLNKTLVE